MNDGFEINLEYTLKTVDDKKCLNFHFSRTYNLCEALVDTLDTIYDHCINIFKNDREVLNNMNSKERSQYSKYYRLVFDVRTIDNKIAIINRSMYDVKDKEIVNTTKELDIEVLRERIKKSNGDVHIRL